jgi:predicted flap endonuclease-1-like 5' DNA nuclease
MKNSDRNTVGKLAALPNIGKSIAEDLSSIGIRNPQQLAGADPFD